MHTEVVRWLAPLAWTAVLALFESTVVALLIWAWSRWRARRAAARSLLAGVGLLGCIVVTAASGLFLLAAPRLSAPTDRPAIEGTAPGADRSAPGPTVLLRSRPSGAPIPRLAPAVRGPLVIGIALGWLAVAIVRLGRLAGGVAAVRALRRRARPLDVAATRALAEAVVERLRPRRRVEWLVSTDVDAPAAVGWRRPAVLLPGTLRETPPVLLEPLIAHEVEHVRRNDWLAAVGLGAAEALLFHCPGARWLGRLARTAREEACDDAAVRVCGGPTRCAEALASLVGVSRPVPALGAKGDGGLGLAARVRRLLKGEEPMNRPGGPQIAFVFSSVAAVTVAAVWLAGAAVADTIRESEPRPAGVGARPPSGHVPALPNAPATIHRPVSDSRYVYEAAQVRNVSEARITGVRFAALRPGARPGEPVRVVESALLPVRLEPGQSAAVRLDLLPIDDLAGEPSGRTQPLLALVEARFDDGDTWAIAIDREASTAQSALYLEPGSVSRALVGTAARPGARGGECLDHRGAGYSPGALLPVLGSSNEWAVCENGTWHPHAAPSRPRGRE